MAGHAGLTIRVHVFMKHFHRLPVFRHPSGALPFNLTIDASDTPSLLQRDQIPDRRQHLSALPTSDLATVQITMPVRTNIHVAGSGTVDTIGGTGSPAVIFSEPVPGVIEIFMVSLSFHFATPQSRVSRTPCLRAMVSAYPCRDFTLLLNYLDLGCDTVAFHLERRPIKLRPF